MGILVVLETLFVTQVLHVIHYEDIKQTKNTCLKQISEKEQKKKEDTCLIEYKGVAAVETVKE
jgi:hypothetical protein